MWCISTNQYTWNLQILWDLRRWSEISGDFIKFLLNWKKNLFTIVPHKSNKVQGQGEKIKVHLFKMYLNYEIFQGRIQDFSEGRGLQPQRGPPTSYSVNFSWKFHKSEDYLNEGGWGWGVGVAGRGGVRGVLGGAGPKFYHADTLPQHFREIISHLTAIGVFTIWVPILASKPLLRENKTIQW